MIPTSKEVISSLCVQIWEVRNLFALIQFKFNLILFHLMCISEYFKKVKKLQKNKVMDKTAIFKNTGCPIYSKFPKDDNSSVI